MTNHDKTIQNMETEDGDYSYKKDSLLSENEKKIGQNVFGGQASTVNNDEIQQMFLEMKRTFNEQKAVIDELRQRARDPPPVLNIASNINRDVARDFRQQSAENIENREFAQNNRTTEINNTLPSKSILSDAAAQLPVYVFGEKGSMTLDMWIRKVEHIQRAYGLSDAATTFVATSKFGPSINRWYNSLEQLWSLGWLLLAVEMREMFGETKSQTTRLLDARKRRWDKRSERLEEYYLEKVSLAREAGLQEEEIIDLLIRGIGEESIRLNLASAGHTSLRSIFVALKNISGTLTPASTKEKNDHSCTVCGKNNHVAAKCFFRNKEKESRPTFKNPTEKHEQHRTRDNRKVTCYNCSLTGNFARDCPTKSSESAGPSRGKIMAVRTRDRPINPAKYYKLVESNDNKFKALVDTGADWNVVAKKILGLMKITGVEKKSVVVEGFWSSPSLCQEIVTFNVIIDGTEYSVPAVATDVDFPEDIILGQPFCDSVTFTVTTEDVRFEPRADLF